MVEQGVDSAHVKDQFIGPPTCWFVGYRTQPALFWDGLLLGWPALGWPTCGMARFGIARFILVWPTFGMAQEQHWDGPLRDGPPWDGPA